MNTLLADVVLLVHVAFVLFVVGGLAAIWLGAAAGWRWVRNLHFRLLHLAAILIVSAEAIAGVWCPLTLWEDALRGTTSDKSFIARWLHTLLYWDFPQWVFTTAYLLFALAVTATLWFVPPVRSRK